MNLTHVDGENKGEVLLFALSTCGWCKKVKDFLMNNNVEFDFIYVDLTSGDQRNETVKEVQKYNEKISFPTLVINGETVLIGFKENEMKEALNL